MHNRLLTFRSVCIEAIAHVLPEEIMSSEAIERELSGVYERLRLPFGRLELMTGIRERRIWPRGTRPSDAAAAAGKLLFEQSPLPRGEIDVICHVGVSRNRLEPATAAYVHRDLGLPPQTQFFDLSNACLGFLNGVIVAAGLIDSGLARRVLLVAGENGEPLLRSTLDELRSRGDIDRKTIKPYFANLTIGCGAIAACISHRSLVEHPLIDLDGALTLADSAAVNLCEGDQIDGAGLMMQTDSEGLLEAGIRLARTSFGQFLEAFGWTRETPDCVICHQVGKTHHHKLYEALELDRKKDFATYPELGNIGSVSLPLTLAKACEEGRLEPGNRLALLGIGSGLSTCMMAGHIPETNLRK